MTYERGYRQDYVAKQIGVNRDTFYKWCNLSPDATLDIGGRYLKRIADFFGCSIEDLLTDKVAA